jgi:hypothetical protein
MERDYAYLRADYPAGFGWLTQDLHGSGAVGDARAATAEKGEAVLEHGARAFIALLDDVARLIRAACAALSVYRTDGNIARDSNRGDNGAIDAGDSAAAKAEKREDSAERSRRRHRGDPHGVHGDLQDQGRQHQPGDAEGEGRFGRCLGEYQFARVKLHVDENGLNSCG